MLHIIIHFQGKNDGDKRYYGEDVAKDPAQSVYPSQNKLVIQEAEDPVPSFRNIHQHNKTEKRRASMNADLNLPLKRGMNNAPIMKIRAGGKPVFSK